MNILIIIFFITLCIGQLGSIQIQPHVYIYFHDIVLVILVAFTGIGLLRKKKIRTGIFTIPIGAFIVASCISLLLNLGKLPWQDVIHGSLYLVRWILYGSLYWVVLNISTPKFWTKMLFLYGCTFTVIGLVQFILYPQLANLTYLGWDPHYYRLFGTILDPNYASLLIGLTIFLGTVYWGVWPTWVAVCINGLLATALVLTYSRSGFLSFIVSGIVYMLLTKRFKMLILLGAFVALFAFIPRSPLDVTSMFRIPSSVARLQNFHSSWELAKQSPIIGFGFNTIRSIRLRGASPEAINSISRAGSGIDNSFLFLIASVGFVGAFVYGWIIYRMLYISKRIFGGGKEGKAIAVVFLTSLIAICIHSVVNNSLFYAWIMIWIWILVGIAERYFHPRN